MVFFGLQAFLFCTAASPHNTGGWLVVRNRGWIELLPFCIFDIITWQVLTQIANRTQYREINMVVCYTDSRQEGSTWTGSPAFKMPSTTSRSTRNNFTLQDILADFWACVAWISEGKWNYKVLQRELGLYRERFFLSRFSPFFYVACFCRRIFSGMTTSHPQG